MTTELGKPINKQTINLNLFEEEYNRSIAPFIQVSNPHNYRWFLYGELSFKYRQLNINDFLTLSYKYFSKNIDCFINEKVLEEIHISSEDKKTFKEYLKFRFHLGLSLEFDFNSDFKDISVIKSEPMFMISTIPNDELTTEETIYFLKEHNIPTETYEIMFKFNSKSKLSDTLYRATKENKEAIFKEINVLLLKNKEAIISLVKKKVLTFFNNQIKLLCNITNPQKLIS